MAITVNTNVYSLAAQRNISLVNSKMMTAIQRLSSGMRINMAKDDAAGLAMAQTMEGQARGNEVAQRVIADGMSFLQVGDAALRSANDMLQRMRELSVQYTSGLYSSTQKTSMSTEFTQLKTEIDASFTRAKFNGQTVVGGGTKAVTVDGNGTTIDISVGTVSAATADITDYSTVDGVLTTLGTAVGDVGAYQSRLEQASNVASAMAEAQWASYGRIMDADMARETARLTSAQVIQQAGAAALAQANSLPQIALGLLR